MSKASGARQELLDELEGHLREEIDRLVRSGISPDNVFETAVSKLGSTSAVAAEFDKLTAMASTWMPIKIARIGSVVLLGFVGWLLIWKAERIGVFLAAHVACVSLGYGLMFVIGALGICSVCARWFGHKGPLQRDSLRGSIFQFANASVIVTGVGVILGSFWARDNWGRYWAWDPKETGAVLIFGWALLLIALGWFKAEEPTVAVFAILGNLVTAWGWFGANAWHSGLSPHFLLFAFTASQLLFVLAGVVGSMAQREHAQR